MLWAFAEPPVDAGVIEFDQIDDEVMGPTDLWQHEKGKTTVHTEKNQRVGAKNKMHKSEHTRGREKITTVRDKGNKSTNVCSVVN